MKRKTRFRFDVWPQLALATLNVVFMVLFIFQKDWPTFVWLCLINFWIIESYFAKRKLFRMREVAIGLFNIINPTKEIGDSDQAEFAVVEENGQRKIDITVTRSLEQTKVGVSREQNKEKDNGFVRVP